jgi:hypothetical protein
MYYSEKKGNWEKHKESSNKLRKEEKLRYEGKLKGGSQESIG